jgi:hypothetical protein
MARAAKPPVERPSICRRLTERGTVEAVERQAIFHFYLSGCALFDNCSAWMLPSRDSTAPERLFSFPDRTESSPGVSEHLFPVIRFFPDLADPYFRIATVTPAKGLRILYCLTGEVLEPLIAKVPEGAVFVICIESEFVQPQFFRDVLLEVFNFLIGGSRSPDKSVLSTLETLRVDKLPNGEDIIVSRGSCDISPKLELARLHHIAFTSLKIRVLLDVFMLLLAGQHMIVTSMSVERVGMGCLALVSLLFPLEWSNVFIPLLPEAFAEILDAPCPYMIGIPFQWFQEGRLNGINPEMVINLDFGCVMKSAALQFEIAPAYQVLAREIALRLEPELEMFTKTGIFPAANIQRLLWQFIAGTLAITAELIRPNPNLTMKELVSGLKKVNRAGPANGKSLRHAIIESQVVTQFIDGIKSDDMRLTQMTEFTGVFRQMQDIMTIVSKV